MKKFHIISAFPESFSSYFCSSMMRIGQEKKLFTLQLYNLYDFSLEATKRIDDKAYGMHGQVITAPVVSRAIEHIFQSLGKKIPVYFLSPRGNILDQTLVENIYATLGDEIIVLCGHYEGVDERVIEKYVDHLISIGAYVISSGELAASVFIDALVRHIPGVLGNPLSLEEESFSEKLGRQKEYPVYTRPRVFDGMSVPEVLISGNHHAIELWKQSNLSE